jgi:hypothetical protein
VVDVVGDTVGPTFGGVASIVVGVTLRITDGAGASVTEVVGAVAVCPMTGGGDAAVVIDGVVVIVTRGDGGGEGCVDRLGSAGETADDVGAGPVDVGAGAVPLNTSGVIGAWDCCGPLTLSTTTPNNPTSSAPPTHRPVWRPRVWRRVLPRRAPAGAAGV